MPGRGGGSHDLHHYPCGLPLEDGSLSLLPVCLESLVVKPASPAAGEVPLWLQEENGPTLLCRHHHFEFGISVPRMGGVLNLLPQAGAV